MPSGSHGGGGGGGHFGGGGGSHFGSSHYGSGGSHFGGSYYHGPKRPGRAPMHFHFFYWGGTRYAIGDDDRSKFRTLISNAIVLILLAVLLSVMTVLSIKELKSIENDYEYYQDMISYAEQHTEYLVDGKVIAKYYNEDFGKWYLTYTFLDQNYHEVEGYTFCIYTREQIRSYFVGGVIKLAVDSIPITQQTDSINIDYKDLPLSEDGQYSTKKTSTIILGLAAVLVFGISAGMIVVAIKKFKESVEPSSEDGTVEPKLKYICTYCGSKLKEEDTTCPKCGASTIETIKEE